MIFSLGLQPSRQQEHKKYCAFRLRLERREFHRIVYTKVKLLKTTNIVKASLKLCCQEKSVTARFG